MLIPSFQGALAFFEQSLVLAADDRFDEESPAHEVLPE
jgi:hypothetical protein